MTIRRTSDSVVGHGTVGRWWVAQLLVTSRDLPLLSSQSDIAASGARDNTNTEQSVSYYLNFLLNF